MRNTIVLKATRREVFRHPLAHGKPSFFHSSALCSTTFVPDGLSELEFISLRNVTIMISENSKREDIAKIYQAVKKSRQLKHIDLKCQLCYASQDNTGVTYVSARYNVGRWKKTLDPLIIHCLHNRIKLTASENNRFRNQECEPRTPRVFDVLEHHDPLVLYIDGHKTLQASNRRIDEAGQAARDCKQQEPNRSFKLTPECRRCYSLFATIGQLKQHLIQYHEHAIPFVRKKYNRIHPLAKAGGDRHACLVCGRSYHSEDFLNDHIEKDGHQRERKRRGVVPRFAKDNLWYRCTSPSSMDELWRGFRGGHWERL